MAMPLMLAYFGAAAAVGLAQDIQNQAQFTAQFFLPAPISQAVQAVPARPSRYENREELAKASFRPKRRN